MYGKIFASMYEGTLYGRWEAIVTFQQLIVLADEDGVIDMTPPAIAARTSIPLEIIEKGIDILAKEDKYSRTPAEEGRRIILVDEDRPWGWQIVNYMHYRNLASREDKKQKDRERIAEKRKKNNDVASCRNVSPSVADVAHTDTDTNTKPKTSRSTANAPDRFDDFWSAYPKKRKKAEAKKKWKAKHLDAKADEIIADVNCRLKQDRRWLDGFAPDPTTYINGHRWEDEIETRQGSSAPQQDGPSKVWNEMLTAITRSKSDRQAWYAAHPEYHDAIQSAGGMQQLGLMNDFQLKDARSRFMDAVMKEAA